MKKTCSLARLSLLIAGLVSTTGCSALYLQQRKRDAADIFTLTAGLGVGGKARFGPIQTGLVYQKDAVGLRSGASFASGPSWKMGANEVGGWDLQAVYFGGEMPNQGELVSERGKDFDVWNMFVPTGWWETDTMAKVPCHYLTQIEVNGGAGLGLRLGVNPGELLDFVLGWATLDLFKDDVPRTTGPSRE